MQKVVARKLGINVDFVHVEARTVKTTTISSPATSWTVTVRMVGLHEYMK